LHFVDKNRRAPKDEKSEEILFFCGDQVMEFVVKTNRWHVVKIVTGRKFDTQRSKVKTKAQKSKLS